MQDGSIVTLNNVYCLPPIFPEMWRLLETVRSVSASRVVTYFQLIVEIVHTPSLDCGMTETGGDGDNVLDRTAFIGDFKTCKFSVSDETR